jgi:hypothetical protein
MSTETMPDVVRAVKHSISVPITGAAANTVIANRPASERNAAVRRFFRALVADWVAGIFIHTDPAIPPPLAAHEGVGSVGSTVAVAAVYVRSMGLPGTNVPAD